MPSKTQPHDDLPEIPPAGIETRAVLRQLTTAARALAALDAASQALPDPAILINTIPMQEAQASSEIENIVTTQDALYRAAAATSESEDPATREALRYRTALKHAYDQIQAHGYSNDILPVICETILDKPAPFRGGGEFVHLRDLAGGIEYTPPANIVVLPRLLDNLEAYILNDEADPLIKMAVAHYQFEAIHPFKDGNGRTGRILNALVLQAGGLLHLPILYLSKYIIEHKDDYYRLLSAVTYEGAWEAWILWMLRAVEVTSNETRERIKRITRLQEETAVRIQEEAPEIARHGVIQVLFQQPYCKISHLEEAGIAKRQTASKYLQALERIGVLRSEKVGRERIYLHPALLEAVK